MKTDEEDLAIAAIETSERLIFLRASYGDEEFFARFEEMMEIARNEEPNTYDWIMKRMEHIK